MTAPFKGNRVPGDSKGKLRDLERSAYLEARGYEADGKWHRGNPSLLLEYLKRLDPDKWAESSLEKTISVGEMIRRRRANANLVLKECDDLESGIPRLAKGRVIEHE